MKKYFSWLFPSAFVLLSSIIVIGCFEGPVGPAGDDGLDGNDGKDGIDASANCAQCHADDQLIVAKQRQWESTAHSEGTSFDYAGSRSGCMPCHNGYAYKATAQGETVTQVHLDNVTSVNCRTCHNIHSSYDTTDWSLSTTAAVKLIVDSTVSTDLGMGNLCARCHQTRKNPMESEKADTVNITSTHWGPHYGAQTNVLLGVGGYEVSGSVSKANSPHWTMVTDGCVDCHMASKNHDFQPQLAGCNANGCHTDLEDFDYNSVQTDIAALLAEVKDSLSAGGIIEIDSATGEVHGHTGVFSKELAGLYQNYLMVEKDGSHGVHNAKYAKYLLTNALEAIKQ